jgi:hypothetical protein
MSLTGLREFSRAVRPAARVGRAVAVCALLVVAGAHAQDEPAPGPGLWERSVDWTRDAWREAVLAWREATGPEDRFAQLWERLLPRLDEAVALEDRRGSLPEEAWLGPDRASNREAVDALLGEAIAILTDSPTTDYRARLRALEEAIAADRERIAALRQARVAAPDESFWHRSRSDYDTEIAELEADIDERRARLAELRRSFAAVLREQGLDLDEERLSFLLSTVVGDDLVEMAAAFDNVRRITVHLETLVVESGEDLAAARRYYGMYTVLLRVLDRMHGRLLRTLDEDYLPGLDAISQRTEELLAHTDALLGQASQGSDPQRRGVLAANREAQTPTLEAAQRYREYLLAQRAALAGARERLSRDIAVAVNTYETVKVSGELVAMMRSGQRLLSTLRGLDVPVLRGFESLAMRRELERLTRRLRADAP